ncbi:unnamed protein product [Rotaria magnacalcarata]|uniref:Uncharacterized protein n=1 Tax=Rotaria magnacalcarata TaxID=392030 RepID=A0A816ZGK4_9BILA|nr:unnamed protein product [Rotaria magnacalcarata]CAF2213065.1 unnamed protein product [Rotaria magnacalcarata]
MNSFTHSINSVNFPFILVTLNIPIHARWENNGLTVAGGHEEGKALNELNLNCPCSLFVDADQRMIIADGGNDRIIRRRMDDTREQVIAGGHGEGNKLSQLNSPSDVLVVQNMNSLIICDRQNRRVLRCYFHSDTISGESLVVNIDWQLSHPEELFSDTLCNIYVVDFLNYRRRKWQRQSSKSIQSS